ncbi:uncharacterized protein [Cicer arietinum]|uniref:Cell wall / vacuolar inhibitor of fructosidase 1-like n=1 Tax=Cicer arietinum TaxID=3827 RepID=A0A1S2XAX9_CICAR|nr:cell wall / vacuolar inhibitor of fructosidase 1-like [Cicer arietinum]
MKVSSFSIIIFFTIISSIQPIQCNLPMSGSIEQICRKTPHYHLCLITLKSNLYSQQFTQTQSVDISGYVRVTLEVVAAKAPLILEQLHEVYAQTQHTQLKNALDSCITSYTKISKELIPQALNCVDKRDYNGVKQSAYVAGNLAASCEKKCYGTTSSSASPLGDNNQYVQDMCQITASIVTKFGHSQHQTLS